MDGFKNGNIISLTLNNFQIFKEQTFHFQPTLNLIAAPNGSGKSSIANALAFVFNGAPKTIGKSKEIAEFIRFGEISAFIAATLLVNGRTVELRRTISKGSRAGRYADAQTAVSQFFIDGSFVAQADYAMFISSVGIDVNNLCTFLPQERVAEFCTMDPSSLLVETLKGTSISLDIYDELRRELKDLEDVIAANSKTKQLVENAMSGMENSVKKLREKEELEKLCVKMAYKMLRLRHDQAVANYTESKRLIRTAETQLAQTSAAVKAHEQEIAEIEGDEVFKDYSRSVAKYAEQNVEINGIIGRIKSLSTQLELRRVDAVSLGKARQQRADQMTCIEKTCSELRDEMESKQRGYEKLLSDFKDRLREHFKESKDQRGIGLLDQVHTSKDLEGIVPSLEDMDQSILGLVDRIRRVQFLSGQSQKEIDELEQLKINHSEQKSQRMELLKKYHADTYKGVCWLRDNPHSDVFEHPVLEPAFIHVNIHKDYLQEIESLLSFQCLSSFLVRNQHDFVALSRILKDGQGLAVNIAEVIPASAKIDTIDRAVLESFGIDGVASDFIEADEEYLRMLRVYSHLGAVPVSKSSVDDAELFSSQPIIKRMVADGQYIEIKRSRYSSEWIVTSSRIATRGVFNFPRIDLKEVERKLARLAEQREANKNEMARLLASKGEYRMKRDALRNEFDLSPLQKAEYAQKSLSTRLAASKASIKSIDADIADFNSRIAKNEQEEALLMGKIKEVSGELQQALDISAIPVFDLEKIRERRLDLENANRQYILAKVQMDSDAKSVDAVRTNLTEFKNEIREVKRQIREGLEGVSFSLEELEDLPDIVEDLEGEINIAQAKIHVLENQTNAMKLYEDKDRERRRLGNAIGEMKTCESGLVNRLEAEKARLVKAIYEYLVPMNRYFSEMFEKLGFIGRLELSTRDEWGLQIMVRFREGEELQQLSSYRQSGGERSLSTVLFLLALQQTKPAPFRLVDEINQGMDAVNEQAVFSIMRDMSMESQFFIITPKLVSGLEFSDSTNSIILYGGPGITSDLENYAWSLLQ